MIDNFRRQYSYLSNFSKHGFTDNMGILFRTNEHFYQAHKAVNEKDFEYVRNALTAREAKIRGDKIKLSSNFDKDYIMYQGLVYKFTQNPDIRNKLIDTGDIILVEGNIWHDNYWGDCSCPHCDYISGQNTLGKLLMRVRQELKEGLI